MAQPDPPKADVDNDADMVRRFVGIFQSVPVPDLIRNLQTEVTSVDIAGRSFPLTLNDPSDAPNCYICRPSAAYIDYAIEETRHFEGAPFLRAAMTAGLKASKPLMTATGLDRQVQVNNWLLSTNPVPRLSPSDAVALRERLTTDYPDRAITMRSLNTVADMETITALGAAGFQMLPSRQIYIYDAKHPVPPTQNQKFDRSLIRKTPYRQVTSETFSDADFSRAEDLYNQLYLKKYTSLNPQYTSVFLRDMASAGLLKLIGLRAPTGQLDGVLGLFENGNTLTSPIVGYDTSIPQKTGLYRMLMTLAQDHAIANGKFFNISAGAARFKRLRGAIPAIEYMAVYAVHLPRKNRNAIRIAASLLTRIGIPLLRRYEL